jgi:folate-binding protein YgfZ
MIGNPWVLFKIEGQNAHDYLNRRTSQQITPETVSEGCLAFLLTAEAKVNFWVSFWSPSPSSSSPGPPCIYVETTQNEYPSLRGDLENKVFSEDVKVSDPLRFSWVSTPSAEIPSVVFRSLNWGFRILPTGTPSENPPADLNMQRVLAKIPIFPIDFNEQFMALDTDIIQAIHFKKGCYPGQEVISKAVHVGKPPHILLWFCASTQAQIDHLLSFSGALSLRQYPTQNHIYGFVRLPRKTAIHRIGEITGVRLEHHAFHADLAP